MTIRDRQVRRRVVALTTHDEGVPGGVAPRRRDPLVLIAQALEALPGMFGGPSVRRSAPATTDHRVQRLRGAVVVVAIVALMAHQLPVGLVVAVVGWHAPRILATRRRGREERELIDATMLATELCAVAVHSGQSIPQSIESIVPFVGGRLGARLADVMAAQRGGTRLDDLLVSLAEELGPVVVPLTTILRVAHADGDPIEPALTRLADRMRDDRRRLVESDVRRLSVRLLIPLVCCSLPGFVLIAVVPLLVGSLAHLGR